MTIPADRVVDLISATKAKPIVVTASAPHHLKDGDEAKIAEVEGNEDANGAFYVKVVGDTSFELYSDKELTKPVEGKGEYESGGKIFRPLEEDYAIVVGINRYRIPLPGLEGAENDARWFYKWLISPTGGNVAMQKTKLLLSSDSCEERRDQNKPETWEPTFEKLTRAFEEFSNRAWTNYVNTKKPRVGRRFYIFLSGHGITPAKAATPYPDSALLAASAGEGHYSEHVQGHQWAQWFQCAAAFDEIFLFMDCCRDIDKNVTPMPVIADPIHNGEEMAHVRYFFGVATEFGRESIEKPFDSQTYGVFTYALMEALEMRLAPVDPEGRLTGAQLKKYLDYRVPVLCNGQKPRIVCEGDLILAQPQKVDAIPAQKLKLNVKFGQKYYREQIELIASGGEEPLDTYRQDPNTPWELKLERGFYKLHARDLQPPNSMLVEVSPSLKQPIEVEFTPNY